MNPQGHFGSGVTDRDATSYVLPANKKTKRPSGFPDGLFLLCSPLYTAKPARKPSGFLVFWFCWFCEAAIMFKISLFGLQINSMPEITKRVNEYF